MEEENWTKRTRSYLASTLPLDTGRAIVFHPEQGSSRTLPELGSTDKSSPEQSTTMSGKEAKQFYEEVLSMPQEHSFGRRKRKLKPSRTGRKPKSKVSERLPTQGEVFRFAQDGELDSLRLALSEGHYNVNITDNFGWTLLMSAAYAGHTNTVQYLMSIGAEWRKMMDSSGQNAVDLALSAGHTHIAELIENCEDDKDSPEEKDNNSYKDAIEFHDCVRGDTSENGGPYFCDICQLTISQDIPHKHGTSTLHQFNCQHEPSAHTVYGIPQSNRGYQMLLRRGWDPEGGLGSEQQGQQFPVKTVLKRDRLGFGIQGKDKARVTHFEAGDTAAIRRPSEECFVDAKQLKKRDIVREAKKDKQWELRMRQYLNTDSDF